MQPNVEAFFDPATFTYSYVVTDPESKHCAIVDSVLDYDPAAGRTSRLSRRRCAHAVPVDPQVVRPGGYNAPVHVS